MRARVLSSLDIGSCTALMPRGPQAIPQRPIAVSNIAKRWSVMAGSKSYRPCLELDAGLESRLGNSCDPPEFRGNLAAPTKQTRAARLPGVRRKPLAPVGKPLSPVLVFSKMNAKGLGLKTRGGTTMRLT